MAKVSAEKYGRSRPKLTQEDLEDGDFIILTIANFEEATVTDEEGTRVTPCLEFKETGDKVLWMNQTQVKYLLEALESDDSDDWIGKRIPIAKTVATFRGKQFNKVAIPAPEQWDELFAESGEGPAKRRVGRPRAAKRVGKKK